MAQEADITKGKKVKKKPRRKEPKGQVYLSNAHPLPTPEELRALLAELAADGDDDGQAAAVMQADTAKKDATMGNPHQPHGRSLTEARVSPPLTAGHQAPSTGDHGAAMASDPMNRPGPRELAWQHRDVRQQSVSFGDVIARLRTVNGDNQNGDRDITYTAGEVGLNLFSARAAAGSYSGMQPVGHSPQRPAPHQSRGSATPPNGSHSTTGSVQSGAVALKASEARELLRRHLFPGSGGGR